MSLKGPITVEFVVPPPGTPPDQMGSCVTSGPITTQLLAWMAMEVKKESAHLEFNECLPIAFERLRQCQQFGYFHPDVVRLRESEGKKVRISNQRSQAGKLGYEKSLKNKLTPAKLRQKTGKNGV